MNNLIQPKILKGFRDFLPTSEILRTDLIEKITNVYRSFGFVPIDTPVLEYTEILSVRRCQTNLGRLESTEISNCRQTKLFAPATILLF